MVKMNKVAILLNDDSNLTFELENTVAAFKQANIEVEFFYESDSIIDFHPDCVIVTTPQDGKLTPYPTYGLINWPRQEYLSIPRFVRNILTYDGYFTTSAELKQTLNDLMFGARKLGTSILDFDFYPAATEFKAPLLEATSSKVIIFEPNFKETKFKTAIHYLLEKMPNVSVLTFSIPDMEKHQSRVILARNEQDLQQKLREYNLVVCLAGNDQRGLSMPLLKVISLSMPVLSAHTDSLQNIFSDNIYYLSTQDSYTKIPETIESTLRQMKDNKALTLNKCRRAHEIFLDSFTMEDVLSRFLTFHEKTLIDKGYMPNPDPEFEKALPSVSFIIRTGGKYRHFLERTLDCLVAQQYPDLRVIFVVHALFPYVDELITNYPSLKIKVVEAIKSRRSEAICCGMAAVETDLFGLYDDDDEMFPNHVRTLVYALQYHTKRDWRGEISMVYSGSLHVDDTYSVPERAEFRDHRLNSKNELRAIEHFRFYSSEAMSQHTWFMPNGWLARSKFIDSELLTDPELDTCEDLYFELQFAQRGHFAFSAEITTVHHFHHFGNSTIVDSYKHFPDTQRIALRNFTRVFPQDVIYDIAEAFRLVGMMPPPEKCPAYQDNMGNIQNDYTANQFYPFRRREVRSVYVTSSPNQPGGGSLSRKLKLVSKVGVYSVKFMMLDNYKKKEYLSKLNRNIHEVGLIETLKKAVRYVRSGQMSVMPAKKKFKANRRIRFGIVLAWMKRFKIFNIRERRDSNG